MSRINVEDSLWSDHRLKILAKELGSEFAAVGALVSFWRLAQGYWVKGELIPVDIFDSLNMPEALLRLRFAERRSDGIYACGAEQQFAWLIQKKEAGKRGGIASGRKRSSKINALSAEAAAKRRRSGAKPPSPSPSPSLPNTTYSGVSILETAVAVSDRNPVSIWVRAYKKKYGVRYAFQKKDFGILKNFGSQYGPDQCELLFACYLAINEKFYSDAKHPLSLFFRDLQKISVAAQTGVDPVKPKPIDYEAL